MLLKPSIAKYSVTIYANGLPAGQSFYQLAQSAHDIVSVLVNAGVGAVAVRIFDRANGDVTVNANSPVLSDAFLVQAESSNSFEYRPTQARQMNKGILINFEEGKVNAEVTILFN